MTNLEYILKAVAAAREDATKHTRVYSETALKLCDIIDLLLKMLEERPPQASA